MARRKLRPQNEVVERCRTLSEELRQALARLPSDDPAVVDDYYAFLNDRASAEPGPGPYYRYLLELDGR